MTRPCCMASSSFRATSPNTAATAGAGYLCPRSHSHVHQDVSRKSHVDSGVFPGFHVFPASREAVTHAHGVQDGAAIRG